MPVKQELGQALSGKWQVELFAAPAKNPLQCCYGCCCPCCAAVQQREELLRITGEPYVCCAGLCPCGPLGEPQDKSCLYVEACCCPGLAIDANRYMVQTRFDRENTPCDDCIITCAFCFACAVDVAKCFVDVPQELEFLADCVIMSVNGCMHAQQHIEIEHIKSVGYTSPPDHIMAMLPPTQQSMIQHGTPVGAGGVVIGAAATGAAMGGSGPKPHDRPPQQQMPAYSQSPYAQPMQQAPMMQQQAPIQVQCGSCRQVFGSPQAGVTVACPFCQTHNAVPAQAIPMGQPMYGGGMYGGGGPGYGPGYGQQGGRPGGNNGMMMAGAAGVGVLGGMMMADALFD
eukprot:TRINITY_DN15698_c0_g2_i1.p1 TRINITY_DN15698_c0_g2~~TRINITY_DN15698_c0_g2_i1.p1  ORF type:complete len:342 (+),score=63.43 TRINITY_DN15698_c0_g2_i1:93-1118(+)